MKNLYNANGFQQMGDGRRAQGGYPQNNYGGQRQFNNNRNDGNRDNRDNRQGGGKFNNSRGGNGQRPFRQGGNYNRDGQSTQQ